VKPLTLTLALVFDSGIVAHNIKGKNNKLDKFANFIFISIKQKKKKRWGVLSTLPVKHL
jgi:hypothetical protein